MCRDRITGNAICIARRSALGHENQGMIAHCLQIMLSCKC